MYSLSYGTLSVWIWPILICSKISNTGDTDQYQKKKCCILLLFPLFCRRCPCCRHRCCSHVPCHLTPVTNTNKHSQGPSPANWHIIHCRLVQNSNNTETKNSRKKAPFVLKIVSFQANIRIMFFDQKSLLHPVDVWQWHTETEKTHKRTNIADSRLIQPWGRVS